MSTISLSKTLTVAFFLGMMSLVSTSSHAARTSDNPTKKSVAATSKNTSPSGSSSGAQEIQKIKPSPKERVLQMEFDIAFGKSRKVKPMIITQNGSPSTLSELDENGDGFEIIVTPRPMREKSSAKSKNSKKNKNGRDPLLAMEIGIKEVKKNNFGPQQNFTMVTRLGEQGEMIKKNAKGQNIKVAVKGKLLPRPRRQ